MAKRTNGFGFKGVYNHETGIIAEYNKKLDTTSYYSIKEALSQFNDREISITFKEVDGIQSVDPDEVEDKE